MPAGAITTLTLKVRRDYSRPEFPRFLVASANGPLTPEDFVRDYVARLGWRPSLRTQNDCWEILAGTIAGCLVPVAPYQNGYYMVNRLAMRWSQEQYSVFWRDAARALARPRALKKAWQKYRNNMPKTGAGRTLLAGRGEVLDAFMTDLLPSFSVPQILGVVDLIYRRGSVAGMPDVAFSRDGAGGFIEVKAPGDKLRDHQDAMHQYLTRDLGVGVWLCELRDEGAADSPEALEFARARAAARVKPAVVATAIRLEEDPNREPMAQEIPRPGPCHSTELVGFTCKVMDRESRVVPWVLQAGIPKLTDAEENADFLQFIDSVLSDEERERWYGDLCAAYRERVASNASAQPETFGHFDAARWSTAPTPAVTRGDLDAAGRAFQKAWAQEKADPVGAARVYRECLATYVGALSGPAAEWVPSHILFICNRLTIVLEKHGQKDAALEELEACAALGLLAHGPKSDVQALEKRRLRLTRRA